MSQRLKNEIWEGAAVFNKERDHLIDGHMATVWGRVNVYVWTRLLLPNEGL